jgi:hypothetical protein
MEALPMVGSAIQLEVSMAAASILGLKVEDECRNSALDAQLEAVAASIHLEAMVAATSKSTQLRETLLVASQVLDPYENPVT